MMPLETLQIESMLHPIANSPTGCGEDLSFSELFSQIQKARIDDQDNLAQGEWVTQRPQSDWPFVLTTTQQLLIDQSKDLRLAMWWAEANTKLNGFGGFAAGLALLSALSEKFWETIYPEAEQGDQEARIILLRWFTTNMLDMLRSVPFGQADTGHELSINQLISARNLDENIRKQPDLEEELKKGKITSAQFQLALTQQPLQFLQQQLHEIKAALQTWSQFTHLMDDKLGYDAPVFTPISDILNESKILIERVTGSNTAADLIRSEAPQPAFKSETSDSTTVTNGLELSGGTHLQSRRQALEALQKISGYFKQNEPHSPVTYLLDKAVYWADLPLHEWLKQVVKQEEVLGQLQELLGTTSSSDI